MTLKCHVEYKLWCIWLPQICSMTFLRLIEWISLPIYIQLNSYREMPIDHYQVSTAGRKSTSQVKLVTG